MSYRFLGSAMKVLGAINSNMIRFYNKEDGTFRFSTFTFGDYDYKVDANGVLYRRETGSALGNYEEVKPSWSKGGIYPEYCLNNCFVKAYQLSLVAIDEDFYDNYMADSSLVVNHMVTEDSDKAFGNGYYKGYRSVVKPTRTYAYNPKYLEVITRGENTRHGRFIADYNLYGVCVSASDISNLSKLLVKVTDKDAMLIDDVTALNRMKVNEYLENTGRGDLVII